MSSSSLSVCDITVLSSYKELSQVNVIDLCVVAV